MKLMEDDDDDIVCVDYVAAGFSGVVGAT